MSQTEQRERMRPMRGIVRRRNVYRWAGQMLVDAAQLREPSQIVAMTDAQSRKRSAKQVALWSVGRA